MLRMAFTPARKHLFYTELAKLLEAGFGIRAAAEVMLGTRLANDEAALLRKLDAGLEAGRSIAEAFGDASPAIGPLEKSIVAAGERGGKLGTAFQHLAGYFGMLANARREIIAALAYPAVLLHLGIFLAVVPGALLEGTGFGSILREFLLTLVAVYGVGVVLAILVVALVRRAAVDPAIDGILRRLPLLGKARRSLAMSRFTKAWHIGTLAGIPVAESTRMAASASQSGALERTGERLSHAAENGGNLGPLMLADNDLPGDFSRAYAIAEEAGGIDKELGRWAAIFDEESGRAVKTLSSSLPKLAYFVIVAFIAWKILSFYGGYYHGILEQLEE